jgi:acetyltransferase-like isoleucine patch superfamily enzyme
MSGSFYEEQSMIANYFNPLNYFFYFKKRQLLHRFKNVGNNLIVSPYCSILTAEYMEIGDNVFIGDHTHISAEMKIGNNIMIGPRSMIFGGDHYFAIKGRSVRFLHPKERENSEPIIIEDEVISCAGVFILKGVVLSMGCVIGANSVVSKSIPPYTVAVGNPCHPVQKIFDDDTLVEHLVILGRTQEEARAIRDRRNNELKKWHLENLHVIDKTKTYWEFKDK